MRMNGTSQHHRGRSQDFTDSLRTENDAETEKDINDLTAGTQAGQDNRVIQDVVRLSNDATSAKLRVNDMSDGPAKKMAQGMASNINVTS